MVEDVQQRRIVVGVCGASGAVYAQRAVSLLVQAGLEVHLAVTPFGRRLLRDELGMEGLDAETLTEGHPDRLVIHRDKDVGACIASGSFRHRGMIIVPCSSNTLGSLANGITDNLVHRAASVCMKERRRLIVGYREMPMSLIDLENAQRLTRAGAVFAPLSPGFYKLPQSIGDLVDMVVARLLDLMDVEHGLPVRWTGSMGDAGS